MKIKTRKTLKTVLCGGALGLFALAVVGCSGGDSSDAPTNTSKSTYMGKGDTAADKIGAQRAAGHRGPRQQQAATGSQANAPAGTQ
jgi:hypothetical protein